MAEGRWRVGGDRLARLRSILRGPFITLVIAVLALVSVVRVVGPPSTASIAPVSPSDIDVGERARGTYSVGNHTILIDGNGVTVSHPRSPGFVWASARDRAFLVAERSSRTLNERRGMVRIAEQVQDSFRRQTVDGADIDSDGRLVITGVLADDEADERLDYQMFLSVRPVRGEQLDMSIRILEEVDRLSLVSELEPGEQVHGLGEQFTNFDLRGQVYPLVAREQGIGRGAQPLSFAVDLLQGNAGSAGTTYAPLPHYITSAPRSLWLRTDAVATADLRTSGRATMTVWGAEMAVSLGVGATPAAHVQSHARATGLMRLPPEWLGDGLIAGLAGGEARVRADVAALQDAGVMLAGVVVEDWAGPLVPATGWSGQLDAERYPDWVDLVGDLAEMDVRVLTNASPTLTPGLGTPVGRDLYAEAAEAGYLVTTDEGQPYLTDQGGFDGAAVDLTDPDAMDWMVDVLAEEVLAGGVAGFLATGGEGPPFDSVTADGPGLDVRGGYPTRWAAVTRAALQRVDLEAEGLVAHRAAAQGTAAEATMFWLGDQLVDFSASDGLRSALDGLLAGGVSGLSLNHFDIGGHSNVVLPGPLPDIVRSTELAQRSAELAAFTSVMRTTQGQRPDRGVQAVDPEVADHLAAMVDLFVALAPERRRLSFEVTVQGLPPVRHPVLVVPELPEVTDQFDVFFLGDDLLVAPMLDEGATRRPVTLPAGSWEHIWTGERSDVARNAIAERIVDGPIGQPPAWARVGSPVAADLQRWREDAR